MYQIGGEQKQLVRFYKRKLPLYKHFSNKINIFDFLPKFYHFLSRYVVDRLTSAGFSSITEEDISWNSVKSKLITLPRSINKLSNFT